jgi:hypothetical protein
MSFLSGFFLWALPLAAVPIVIHLLHRRRRETVQWGAMQLLLDSVPRRRRIWQINDLLLMILRALAVAAVIFAFAGPQVRSGVLTGKSPGRDVTLIVDSSLSTGRLVNGTPVFEGIKQKAQELLKRLNSSDQVRLMVAASAPHWVEDDKAPAQKRRPGQTTTTDEIAARLASLKPTLATADAAACVQAALATEPRSDATSRLIVVVTDGAAHGWSADAGSRWQAIRDGAARAALPTAIHVVTADLPKTPAGNLCIEKLSTTRTRVGVAEPFTIMARVRNNGGGARRATSLKWEMDGQPSSESAIVGLEPGQSVDVAFEGVCDHAGVFPIRSRLVGEDELPGDNEATIVIESLARLQVLVCRRDGDSERPKGQPDFLMAALGRVPEGSSGEQSTSVFEPTVVGVEALESTDLSLYRCIILDDVLPGTGEIADRLSDYVTRGGGLWMILGEGVTPDQFNSAVFRNGAGLVPISLGKPATAAEAGVEFFTIHPPDANHPATVLLGDTERLDIDDVRITKRTQLIIPAATDDVSVLLETGDGAPLAVEYFNGDGRIIVQGIPQDSKWSNLPLCQVFVPLVQEWIWYLTQPTAANYNLDPGKPIVVTNETNGRTLAQIQIPSGETVSFSETAFDKGPLRFRDTLFPGDYLVTITPAEAAGRRVPFSVRRDGDESRLDPLSAEQIAQLEKSGGLQFNGDPLVLPNGSPQTPPSRPIWNALLLLVALLFVGELLFARILTGRRYADASRTPEMVVGGAVQ